MLNRKHKLAAIIQDRHLTLNGKENLSFDETNENIIGIFIKATVEMGVKKKMYKNINTKLLLKNSRGMKVQ